jgi:hypothetical protein
MISSILIHSLTHRKLVENERFLLIKFFFSCLYVALLLHPDKNKHELAEEAFKLVSKVSHYYLFNMHFETFWPSFRESGVYLYKYMKVCMCVCMHACVSVCMCIHAYYKVWKSGLLLKYHMFVCWCVLGRGTETLIHLRTFPINKSFFVGQLKCSLQPTFQNTLFGKTFWFFRFHPHQLATGWC